MASSRLILFAFFLSFLLLTYGSFGQPIPWKSERPFGRQRECRLEQLSALEPTQRIESEAGVTEFWDQHNQQLDCAGVAVKRTVMEPRSLLLPVFSNAPQLIYIVQGRGITGTLVAGCPETFQAFQQSEQQQTEGDRPQKFRDQHQKIHHFRQGDIIALPAGVAHWSYNDGDTPVVAVTVFDTSSSANQLDRNRREFLLAGRQQGGRQRFVAEPAVEESYGNNILAGFDVETLAEACGVSRETARKLQSQDEQRGHIVKVEEGLRLVRPPRMEEEWGREESRQVANGLEETFCAMRVRENIAEPMKADVYTPRGGRITSLNSQKLPILRFIQLSAERGVLYGNAFLAPHWNINAHSVMYVTGGRGRVQVVNNRGQKVFDGEVRPGQLLVVPQNFAVVKQALSEGFEWTSFKTNDNAMINPIVGKTSAIRGMPVDVIANCYRVSVEEARRLKFNRGDEYTLLAPRSEGKVAA